MGRVTLLLRWVRMCARLCVCAFLVADASSPSSPPDECTCTTVAGEKIFDCAGLRMTSLPLELPPCGDGAKIRANFSGNFLQSVEARTYLSSVVSLDLSRNRIEDAHDLLAANLSNLRELRLSHNSLCTLPRGLRRALAGVTSLHLSHNAWRCDCALVWLAQWLRRLETDSPLCAGPEALSGRPLADLSKADVCHGGGLGAGTIVGIILGIFVYFSILSVIAICINIRRRLKTGMETTNVTS